MRRALLATGLVSPFFFAVMPLLSLLFATTPPAEDAPAATVIIQDGGDFGLQAPPNSLALQPSNSLPDCSLGSHTAIDG